MVCSETRGSCGKDTMDVLHLHWVFIHLNAEREREMEGGREGRREGGRERGRMVGGWWEDGERRGVGRKRREDKGGRRRG